MSALLDQALLTLDPSGRLAQLACARATIGLSIARPDGTPLWRNPAACALSGLSTLNAESPTEQALGALLSGETSTLVGEQRVVSEARGVLWCRETTSVLGDAGGAPEFLLTTIEDITLQKLTALATEALATTCTGISLLERVTQTMAELLGVESALVSDLGKEGSVELTPLVFWSGDSFISAAPRPLAGSACHSVIGETSFLFDERDSDAPLIVATGARERFPDDTLLAEHGIDAYAGVALWASINVPMGTLAIMSRQPLKNIEAAACLLGFLASRVAAELRQQRENRRFQDLFDSSPMAILLLDTHGTIHLANRASEALLGWTSKELPGREFGTIVPHIGALGTGTGAASGPAYQPGGMETQACHRDGSTFAADVHLVPIETGTGAMVVAYVADITLRKQIEELQRNATEALEEKVQERTIEINEAHLRLARKEEENRAVLDNIVDGVVGMDEAGCILSINPAVTTMLGYAPGQVIAQPIGMLISEWRNQRPEPGDFELHAQPLDAEAFECEWTVSEYRVHDQLFYTGVLRDIRERKRLMHGLESARDAAEQASRAKTNFLATMSHEIRTPMNGVIGMIELLEHSGLRDEQRDMIKTVRSSAFSLLSIIDDVLDFSKIEADQMGVESVPLSVAAMAEEVCDTLDAVAEKAGITLSLFTDPALPPACLGDPTRLRQVLMNLAGNAIKFTRAVQGGRVAVRAELEPGESPLSTLTLHLSVTDNGVGISPEAQANLFKPFSQADETTTRRFGGTGLGLSISRRLTELMGGTISVRSEPGKGACFSVHLPVVPATMPENGEPAGSRAPRVDVRGTECLVVGEVLGLAPDLVRYLSQGEARITQVPTTKLAADWMLAQGTRRAVVIVDEAHAPKSPLSPPGEAAASHVVFLVMGQGKRRQPRFVAERRVGIDFNVMHQSAFLMAVALAAGRASVPVSSSTPEAPTASRALWQGARILVAEDNELNQKVLLKQLALLGLQADVGDNGEAAFDLWRKGRYPLLLTDLHMPEMDGYQLARAIRASEVGGERMPIVALTANALKGEMQTCLDCGMDDYFTKPLRLPHLEAMLARWLCVAVPVAGEGVPPASVTPPKAPDAAPTPKIAVSPAPSWGNGTPPVDVSVLVAMIGDDPADIREFLNDFRVSAGKIAADIQAAYQQNQPQQVGELAHKLKSSARSVGALALGELCASLEVAGKQSQSAELASQVPVFENEARSVICYLESHHG
ncbi:MAG: PAS domain S-box protein [Rhodocyclaceae bacterium]|nr:PAS domain S-box protein [Rhodocyclaceae bacterium]